MALDEHFLVTGKTCLSVAPLHLRMQRWYCNYCCSSHFGGGSAFFVAYSTLSITRSFPICWRIFSLTASAELLSNLGGRREDAVPSLRPVGGGNFFLFIYNCFSHIFFRPEAALYIKISLQANRTAFLTNDITSRMCKELLLDEILIIWISEYLYVFVTKYMSSLALKVTLYDCVILLILCIAGWLAQLWDVDSQNKRSLIFRILHLYQCWKWLLAKLTLRSSVFWNLLLWHFDSSRSNY